MAGNAYSHIAASGNQIIDGLLYGIGWSGPITYAFPAEAADYAYDRETDAEFAGLTRQQQNSAAFALDQLFGNAANDGFSIEGFTNADISSGDARSAQIRVAQSALPLTAYTYLPGDYTEAGDVWLGKYSGCSCPNCGNYGGHTVLHEMGHAMGLKHGHDPLNGFDALPSEYDSLEVTVMTYRSFAGGSAAGGYTYDRWSAPQTYMMGDIAALQYMYGADFETNGGDTVYSWRQGNADTFVNGARAINAGGDTIFATIWDGGGIDTYDLGGFRSKIRLSLEPGESSRFNTSQLADLGRGHHAQGNIYNALQYQGDIRSLIENAIGGRNRDWLAGNGADNTLSGRRGDDRLLGAGGGDTLEGGAGNDRLDGGDGNDVLEGSAGNDRLSGGAGDDRLAGGRGHDLFIFDTLGGHDVIIGFANGLDRLSLAGTGWTSAEDIIANAVQVDDDVVITLSDSQSITLADFELDRLDAKDFLW